MANFNMVPIDIQFTVARAKLAQDCISCCV